MNINKEAFIRFVNNATSTRTLRLRSEPIVLTVVSIRVVEHRPPSRRRAKSLCLDVPSRTELKDNQGLSDRTHMQSKTKDEESWEC